MKKLNNKGYLLIEIILATALAVGMAYFMIRLVLQIKERNDELLVKNLTSTDQGIIYNYFMKKVYADEEIDVSKITYDNSQKTLKYNGETVINLNKYAKFKDLPQNISDKILIKIAVNNMEDESFDVIIYLKQTT